jgi:predicted DNA-binding antitoxin AbrB/MazE fold protein
MTQRITAIFENGLLRPTKPLPLRNGDRVVITVETPGPAAAGTEDAIQRIRDAKTFDEWIAAAAAAADLEPDDGYDLEKALNDNRRAAGIDRMLYPAK